MRSASLDRLTENIGFPQLLYRTFESVAFDVRDDWQRDHNIVTSLSRCCAFASYKN
jgi:hypothetical protein